MGSSPDQHGEIDGIVLKAIVRRFRSHHAHRIARTGERLMPRQRRVLEALAMLYHRNHPALPGYVGPDVPSGIARYRPGPAQVQALRTVARSYVEPRPPPTHTDLQAMFLMGSGGTVGQSRGSDIDLWVCCDTLMHSALWPKVRMIDGWAAELGLELHTFLVDPDVLRRHRRLPGCRIPMLVLDEFYRTGALIAGRRPLWWLVPEDEPGRYEATAERLIGRRFVDPDSVVDFGPVPAFPADELAQAAITELDRALVTPHKSLLKLKLMEAYAEAPELGPVSSAYRARIHAGESQPLRLDPYLLLYEHVERHLELSGREDELAFVRALLIGKTAASVPLQQDPRRSTAALQPLLQRFLDWGFDVDDVARFRDLDHWSMRARLHEHERIMTALEDGVRLVRSLVDKAAPQRRAGGRMTAIVTAGDAELHWLNETRLLQIRDAVSRLRSPDRDTVDVLHPALVRRTPLALELLRDGDGWLIREGDATVIRPRRLVEAATWAELNGARLTPSHAEPTLAQPLAQVLQGFRDQHRSTCAFVNAESSDQRTTPAAADAGRTLLTSHNDPLDYSGFHQLHLRTLDVVRRDPRGHWRLESMVSDDAVLEGVGRLFASPPDSVSWQVCGGQQRLQLARRLEQLHALASRILATSGALFVLPYGADMLTVLRTGDAVETRRHRSLGELQSYVQSAGCATVGVDPVSHRLRAMLRAS